ncbi:hypothetical protein GCM10023311_01520 [Flaviramulus aquimarinus]|uniref:FKBP-type peptidyl-prolyl cis-trans isomerase FkpA n=1 Tax=Flaviramulus aquimarinus TaxID=1170456 RepID=A0ABP9EPF3_9FLAO
MRQLFFVLIFLSLIPLYSCDDGDIINIELDFDDTFQVCGNNDLVFYKTKDDPSESLSLKISGRSLAEFLEVGDDNTYEETITINTSNPFNYRTYSNTTLPSNLFCNDIPNSEVTITQDFESTDGSAIIKTVLTEDDDDDVPVNLDIDSMNDDDTDGDGILNYIDADDDGDNILTKNENPDPNGDGDLSDAQDTDNDGIPDYLDDDDDGDGVKTRDEENDSQDQNPANDFTESEIADYLNPEVSTTVTATAYREHSISETYVVTLNISNFDLTLISLDEFDFGALVDSELSSTRKETPDFN